MATIMTIYNHADQTGPAEILHGRVARIVGPVPSSTFLWENDVVLIDGRSEQQEQYPRIKRRLWTPYPQREDFFFAPKTDLTAFRNLLRINGADCLVVYENGVDGLLRVAHNGIDALALAVTIGLTLRPAYGGKSAGSLLGGASVAADQVSDSE